MDVKDRFLTYVSYFTTSDEDSDASPTTARQLDLTRLLAEELRSIGLTDAEADGFGYVWAHLPANTDTDCGVGFISHVDTAPGPKGEGIRPRVLHYTGGDIRLSDTVTTAEADFPSLAAFVGQDVIVTDGTTLLGADDKAGVAEIVSAVEYLVRHPEIPRKHVAVCFTPDEEVGKGTAHFDFDKFGVKEAYTVDGGVLGEIEYENFNAAAAVIRVRGVAIHPGSAKNKMKNAVLMACDFVSRLPAAEAPAHTEGYEGFYHVTDVSGDEEAATVKLIIRDHDAVKFEKRKAFVADLAAYMNKVYGGGTFTAEIKDSYYNMRALIEDGHMHLIENAKTAMEAAGVTPKIVPIRGGTDGAMLTYRGLPCPNLSVAGDFFHGVHEIASVQGMEKMRDVIVNLAKLS